jgi:hypothetical protein
MDISNQDQENSAVCEMRGNIMIDAEGNTVSADLSINFTLPDFADITVDEEGIDLFTMLAVSHGHLRASWGEIKGWLMRGKP